jgi:thermostable 8-oxoguanine DNA glycosylase
MSFSPVNVLHDKKKASDRIKKEGRFHRIGGISNLVLTESNFKEAGAMHERESAVVLDRAKLSDNGLFRGMAYCLLTPLQQYDGQAKGFGSIEPFCSPEKAFANRKGISQALKNSGVLFHGQKARYISELGRRWESLNLLNAVEVGIKSGGESEILLRKFIVNYINGFGHKTASLLLRMCGAEYLVPVDSWMLGMLYLHGYPCEIPRAKRNLLRWKTNVLSPKLRKQALSGRKYLEAEEMALDLARKYGVPGYVLQLAFYTKKSSYQSMGS